LARRVPHTSCLRARIGFTKLNCGVHNESSPKLPSHEVFLYFDNDAKVRAPVDAQAVIARVEKLLPR